MATDAKMMASLVTLALGAVKGEVGAEKGWVAVAAQANTDLGIGWYDDKKISCEFRESFMIGYCVAYGSFGATEKERRSIVTTYIDSSSKVQGENPHKGDIKPLMDKGRVYWSRILKYSAAKEGGGSPNTKSYLVKARERWTSAGKSAAKAIAEELLGADDAAFCAKVCSATGTVVPEKK